VTEDEMTEMQGMLGRMMQKYPEWKGLISPEEAVRRILNVGKESVAEQSGQFLSYWGNNTLLSTALRAYTVSSHRSFMYLSNGLWNAIIAIKLTKNNRRLVIKHRESKRLNQCACSVHGQPINNT
jgi:hypothetical protein